MKQTKIAFIGKIRSGKSTCTKILREYYGFERVGTVDFGTKLREVVSLLSDENKDRAMLQAVGQKMREIDPEIWIKQVDKKLKEHKYCGIIICESVRQQNEYDYLKSQGFKFIKIETPIDERVKRCISSGDTFKREDLNFESEMEMDNFEYDELVINDGDIDSLELKIRRAYRRVK